MFRMAQNEDIEQLSKLRILQQKEDWQEEYPIGKDNEFYEATKNYLTEQLNKQIFFFLEIEDNQIIAHCGLQIMNYMPQCVTNGREGFLCDVFTLKEDRRKGIQTNLLQESLKFAQKNNLTIIKLETDNPEAIKIYQKLGFTYNNLIMEKIIE